MLCGLSSNQAKTADQGHGPGHGDPRVRLMLDGLDPTVAGLLRYPFPEICFKCFKCLGFMRAEGGVDRLFACSIWVVRRPSSFVRTQKYDTTKGCGPPTMSTFDGEDLARRWSWRVVFSAGASRRSSRNLPLLGGHDSSRKLRGKKLRTQASKAQTGQSRQEKARRRNWWTWVLAAMVMSLGSTPLALDRSVVSRDLIFTGEIGTLLSSFHAQRNCLRSNSCDRPMGMGLSPTEVETD